MTKIRSRNNLWSILGVWLVTVVIWGAYRYFSATSEWIEEIIYKPIIFIFPPLVYLFKNNQLSFANLGLRTQNKRSIIFWGLGFGLVLVIENILVWQIKGQGINQNLFHINMILTTGIISLATSFSEEVLYRGFLLARIWKTLNNFHFANLITSLLFGIGHLSIGLFLLNYTGNELWSYLLLIVVLGYIQGVIYERTGSVYASTIAHALWNFSNVFLS